MAGRSRVLKRVLSIVRIPPIWTAWAYLPGKKITPFRTSRSIRSTGSCSRLADELHQAMLDGKARDQLAGVLARLVEYTKGHFAAKSVSC